MTSASAIDRSSPLLAPSVPLYDAHNHLHDAWLAPHRAGIVSALAVLPLRAAVVNGTCESDWPEVAALAREHRFVVPSFGLHPWHVGNASPHWRESLERLLEPRTPALGSPFTHPAAVGEIGLDRWILDRARPDDPRLSGLRRAPLDEQREAFAWQLRLAAERNLPVTLHCLDAWGPLLEILRTSPRPARGFLLHACGSSAELAGEFAQLGAYFSFNGAFLAERHAAKRAVFAALPADRLLVETDAPAMPLPLTRATHALPPLADGTPVNHPANIAAAYVGLATLRATPLPALARQVETNFRAFFRTVPPVS